MDVYPRRLLLLLCTSLDEDRNAVRWSAIATSSLMLLLHLNVVLLVAAVLCQLSTRRGDRHLLLLLILVPLRLLQLVASIADDLLLALAIYWTLCCHHLVNIGGWLHHHQISWFTASTSLGAQLSFQYLTTIASLRDCLVYWVRFLVLKKVKLLLLCCLRRIGALGCYSSYKFLHWALYDAQRSTKLLSGLLATFVGRSFATVDDILRRLATVDIFGGFGRRGSHEAIMHCLLSSIGVQGRGLVLVGNVALSLMTNHYLILPVLLMRRRKLATILIHLSGLTGRSHIWPR